MVLRGAADASKRTTDARAPGTERGGPATRFTVPSFVYDARGRDYQDGIEQQWQREQDHMRRQEQLAVRSRQLSSAGPQGLTNQAREALLKGELYDTPALAAAKRWVHASDRPVLVLSGGTGCGKTVAAAWYTLEHTTAAIWLRPSQVTSMFEARFGDLYDEQQRVRACAALVVEDVGRERHHPAMQYALAELLESRQGGNKRTVITTPLARKLWSELYPDERIESLMHELVLFAACNAPDLRRQGPG